MVRIPWNYILPRVTLFAVAILVVELGVGPGIRWAIVSRSEQVVGAKIDITDTGTGAFFVGVIPGKVLAAIKLLCGHWYENREDVVVGVTTSKVKRAVESLLMASDRVLL